MRELELREKKINDIQAMGEKLVRDGHPGKNTVEVNTTVIPFEQENRCPKSQFMKSSVSICESPICQTEMRSHVLSHLFVTSRPSQLPNKLSGAGSSSCAAALRLISKKTQPTTRYGAKTSK